MRAARLRVAVVVASGLGAPGSVRAQVGSPSDGGAQLQCEVLSTFLGNWNGPDVSCDPGVEGSRAASVTVDALHTCPLLAGDRVDVGFVDDDPARQPLVLAVATRGGGGRGSDWCTRGLPPGPFTGPCLLEEDPPPGQSSDSVGATSTRHQINTWFRTVDDDRTSVSPGSCRPARLTGGVYRIYIEESMQTSVRVPGPTYFAGRSTSVTNTWETVRYEGGVFVDASLPASQEVTDVSGFVRGWSGPAATVVAEGTTEPTLPIRVTTGPIVMTGYRVEPIRVRTAGIRLTGYRVEPIRVRTAGIRLTGYRVPPIRVRTTPVQLTGFRVEPIRIVTDRIVMTGLRPPGN